MHTLVLASLIAATLAGKPPAEYILSKVDAHRIVLLGEHHWLRRDAELVALLVPELQRRGVPLAIEWLQSRDQEKIDALVSAPEWNVALANEILRGADWPYVQYRDVLLAAWQVKEPIIALGPGRDFREKGIGYDEFMAERLKDVPRVVVLCGMHHAFTKYLQVERLRGGRATEFMERFGNILYRRHGQEVFLIALDKPEMCGPQNQAETRYCLPFAGAIECAADGPVGFDVLTSPFAELKFPPESYYAHGHPLLRFIDYADGYVWTEPIAKLRTVDLIPLQEWAPEKAADPEAVAAWKKRAERLSRPFERQGWSGLLESRCP